MPEDSLDDDVMEHVTPVVFVLSDARGKTAAGVVEAAADQFGEDAVIIKQLGNVRSVDMVKDYLDRNLDPGVPVAVFHTLVDRNLRRDIRRELDKRGIPSIDLLGPAITVLSTLTDQEPIYQPGHRTDTEVQEVQ
ncbi:MAG: kinase/pyrophosphorylase [Olsenella sp.]|jgi:regulator of PEP synthase PpsR (kinase-PPPase family)|nr:kinase/pyrophosphorylase [Olsenella sp.]